MLLATLGVLLGTLSALLGALAALVALLTALRVLLEPISICKNDEFTSFELPRHGFRMGSSKTHGFYEGSRFRDI